MRLIKSCIRILVARSGIPDAVCTRMLTLAVADAVPLGPMQGCFAALAYGSGRSGKQRDHGFLRGARFSLLHCGRGRRRESFLVRGAEVPARRRHANPAPARAFSRRSPHRPPGLASNVCRVYDIGQAEGMPFISMEYVDGEDLASLLLRIGRLPADKALETARKLCAGLAAAHDRGIIHRDLKPQNIMMNKRGDVVIMDFGLAAIAGQLSGAEVRNGTPAYMAPEQLRGAEVTAKSDIYALGLVLYELFTGKRPFDANTVQAMLRQQESAQLTSMTSIAADIDPGVEKAIRRCLDPDPARRPANGLSVAAALPGGDPLAAALAAGEMPSPELVASAGKLEGLAPRYSIPCRVAIVVCLCGAVALRARYGAIMHTPLDNPPEVLAHQAREMASSFGYPKRPADSALSLNNRGDLLDRLQQLPQPHRWDEWLAAEAPIFATTARASPHCLPIPTAM